MKYFLLHLNQACRIVKAEILWRSKKIIIYTPRETLILLQNEVCFTLCKLFIFPNLPVLPFYTPLAFAVVPPLRPCSKTQLSRLMARCGDWAEKGIGEGGGEGEVAE